MTRKPLVKPADKIAFLALIVTLFAMLFSVYQFKEAKKDATTAEKILTDRFNKSFAQMRFHDSVEIDLAKRSLDTANSHFKLEFNEVQKNNQIQTKLTITNLRNSVRPFIQVFKRASKNSGDYFGIGIVNSGLGPAIIDKVIIKFDKHIINVHEMINAARNNHLRWWDPTTNNDRPERTITSINAPEFAVRQGDSIWVLKVKPKAVEYPTIFENFIVNHLTIRVKYHSLTSGKHEIEY